MPFPSIHPLVAPGTTVIWPNGTISNASAPIAVAGSTYTLTAGFYGGILDERSGSVLNGNGMVLSQLPGLSAAVTMFQANGVVVENLTIENATDGLDIVSDSGVTVRHDHITAVAWAVLTERSSQISIVENVAPFSSGIGVDSSVGVWLENNTVADSTRDGIVVFGCSSVGIVGNQAAGSVTGALIEFSNGVTVRDNNFSAASTGLSEYAVFSSNVSGNAFSLDAVGISVESSGSASLTQDAGRNGSIGVLLSGSENLAVFGESFPGFGTGVEVEGGTNISISRGQFQHDGLGIAIVGSNEVAVSSSNVSGFSVKGIAVDSAANVVLGSNAITEAVGPTAVAISTQSDQQLLIRGNTVTGDYAGLLDTGSVNLTAEFNDFSHAKGTTTALSLAQDSRATALDNRLINDSFRAILVANSQGLLLSGNNASFAGFVGIELVGVVGGSVQFNAADHAQMVGIEVASSSGLTVANNTAGWTLNRSGIGFLISVVSASVFAGNNASGANVSFEFNTCAAVQLLGNNGSRSGAGMLLDFNTNATVAANQFWYDAKAFVVYDNSATWIYHNNFVNDSGWSLLSSIQAVHWDAGYPEGGNFWSNHTGPDQTSGPNQTWVGSDGIVDTPVALNSTNVDRYPLTSLWTGYAITFTESGLAGGTVWKVLVNGVGYSSGGKVIIVPLANGPGSTYQFTVPPVVGYQAALPSSGGPWPEARSNVGATIAFTPFLFPVTFDVYGLAAGTQWSVTIGSTTILSTTGSIHTSVANGTITYLAGKVPGYTISSGSGGFSMAGAPWTINIIYSSVGATPATYSAQMVYTIAGALVVALILAVAGFALRSGARGRRPRSAAPRIPAPPSPATGGGNSSPPPGAIGEGASPQPGGTPTGEPRTLG